MVKTRTVTCAALLIYMVGVAFFALHPTNDIKAGEWVAAIVAGIAAVGLIAHALPQVTLPGEDLAYAITGFAGFTTLLLYLVDTADSPQRRTAISLFLLAGVVGAYGALLGQEDDGG